mgnify:CR=1 FL=1
MNKIIIFIYFFFSLGYSQDWELVWSDEFNGNGAIDTEKWFHQTQLPLAGSWYNGEIQHYTDRTDNSYVSDGTLKIVAKEETYTDQGYTKQYTSARLNSKYAFTYGKIEIRALLPQGIGTWPAIWMLGKNINEPGAYWETQGFGTTPWPACGEVDIMEHWGSNQNYVQSAIHTPSSFGGTINHGGQYISTASTQFHLYTLEWSEDEMVFSVDGNIHYSYNPTIQNSDTWPFDSELYLLLNIAIQPSISSTYIESAMEIDYIRIYQNIGQCSDIVCDEGQECQEGECVDLPSDPTVTFLVDMTNEEIDDSGVYVSGSDAQLAGPSGLLMTEQADNIWSLTISPTPGTYTYKFRNGFYDYWDGPGWEPDLPDECGFGQWNDRQFTFENTDLILGPYYFGSCELSEQEFLLGDINSDGEVNVLDIINVVNMILGDFISLESADINQDGLVNIIDILELVNMVINE